MSIRSERIKELVDNSDLSYHDLEKITGIKKSSLQRYASGVTSKIPLEVIEKLSVAFNVSKNYLMGWDDAVLTREDAEILEQLPPLHPKESLPPEVEALNALMHQFGYNIMKVDGQYFMAECGEITNDELNELLNTVLISIKNAADTMIAKKTREFRDFLSNRNK